MEVHDAAETLENDFSALGTVFILEVGFEENAVQEHKLTQTLQERHQDLLLLFGQNGVGVKEFRNLEGSRLFQRVFLQFLFSEDQVHVACEV